MGSRILKAISVLVIRMVIASIAISFAASEIAFAKDLTEYWAETGLSDSHLKKFLSQKRCYANENSFVGCIAAINSILDAGYPKNILTNKSIENMNVIGDTVTNVQRLKIQRIKNTVSLDDQKIMAHSWASVYKLTLSNQIQLEEILDQALSLTTQKARSMKIALAINQYYKNALDPHTYIIATKARTEQLNTSESAIVGGGIEKNLEVQIMNDPIDRSQIGYIKLATFNDVDICHQFLRSAIALHNKGVKSLVLDLRGNGGGLVSQAKCIASSYLENGKIIFTENDPVTNKVKRTHRVEKYGASIYNLYGKKPLVILIDSNSASASEMISGALRAYNRAILIGERSFGKGTIQSELQWKEDGFNTSDLQGIEIMKTTARFHFVNGESNQQVGLTPDIEASSLAVHETTRETDLYSNAISSVSLRPYTPSALAISTKACIAQRNMLGSSFTNKINSRLAPDYPMSVAREAASCL